METKVTLHIEEDILKKITQFALKQGKTLDDLTVELYKWLLSTEIKTPIAKKYKGILGKKYIDLNETKLSILKEKHIL